MNIFFRGSTGFQRLNITRFATSTMVPESRFITSREGFERSWDIVENKSDALFASSKNSLNRSTPRSTQWLEDADFLRLQNISLSYLLPKNKTKFADITLGVSAQNLFTITKYKGLDHLHHFHRSYIRQRVGNGLWDLSLCENIYIYGQTRILN